MQLFTNAEISYQQSQVTPSAWLGGKEGISRQICWAHNPASLTPYVALNKLFNLPRLLFPMLLTVSILHEVNQRLQSWYVKCLVLCLATQEAVGNC